MPNKSLATKLMASLALVSISAFSTAAALGADYTMRLGVATRNDPIHHYAERYAERIEAASEGRIRAETFPGGELGSIQRMLENLQLGTMEMVVAPPAFARGINRGFDAATVSGLFEDIEHASRALQDEAFRDTYLALAADRGLTGVGLWAYGPTSYATRQPVESLEDFQGMRIRTIGTELENAELRSLGATAVPMPFIEIVPAMQNRSIDGVRSSLLAMNGVNMQSAAEHLTITQEALYPIAAFVSTAFIQRLPEELQQVVHEVGAEVEREMLEAVQASERRVLEAWREEGVNIIEFDDEQRAYMSEMIRTASESVLAQDEQTFALYNLLVESAERHR